SRWGRAAPTSAPPWPPPAPPTWPGSPPPPTWSPRRVWVRATPGEDGHTRVELAGLGKTEVAGDNAEFHEITTRLVGRLTEQTRGGEGER
ncbi:hypothetical protein ABZ634_07975, partial [Nocardiopsis alba]